MGDKVNFEIIDSNNFKVKINSSNKILSDLSKEDKIKKIMLELKKKYSFNIYGFYEVDIYNLGNFVTYMIFKRKDEDDYYYKSIELKINEHKYIPQLLIDDFTLLKKYNKNIIEKNKIFSNIIKKEDVYKLCEHYVIEPF